MASAGWRKNAGVPVLEKRGRDLPADDARLAHARDDDAPAAVEQQVDGALETLVEAIDEREDGGRLRLQHSAGQVEIHAAQRPLIRRLQRGPRPALARRRVDALRAS